MRHRVKGKKLGRQVGPRRALTRNLVTSLLMFDKIETTESKAKVVGPKIERIIRNAKKMELRNAITYLKGEVFDENASKKVLEVLIDKYKDRDSGFTRVLHLEPRRGDGARMARLELV
jgi:large subunit ribosomal protein L17